MDRWLMVTLDFPPTRGGIQTYLGELARRLPQIQVIAPAVHPETNAAWDGSVERVALARTPGWWSVPPLIARTFRRLATGRYAGVLFGHVKLAAALPLIARHTRTVVLTYGMEVTAGRFKRLERCGLRRAWRVVTISGYTGDHLRRLGVPPDRLRLVPPGVALPAAGRAARGATLLSVGRIERSEGYKGHERVLDVLPALAARFPDVRWVVVGGGSGLSDLSRSVEAKGLSARVQLTGEVTAAELEQHYRAADVFVLPGSVIRDPAGERFEGFGIVFLEAASYGVPVIAGSAGGAPDAVADGETGYVIDPDDPAALQAALERLLADPELRRRMGEAGRQRIATAYTWDHAARKLAGVLAEAE